MLDQKSLFKARSSTPTPVLAAPSSAGIGSLNGTPTITSSTAVELTKNSKYCVSKLPASPSILSSGDASLNGYTDHFSKYSVVINDNSINVWSYKSIDSTPLSIEFPLSSSSTLPPLAILTKPASSNVNSDDPGLVIIDSISGHVKFYESVQHAPALGLIDNKLLELTIPLKLDQGEYITLAENAEPAGIVVATSLKRVVLIGLRDFISKPRLTLTELMSPVGSGLFSKFFKSQQQENADVIDEIVSIKTSKIIEQGMSQDILICDSNGTFSNFQLQLVTPNINSGPLVNKNNSYTQYLLSSIENNIEGYLPGSSLRVKVLDLWPLKHANYEDIYLVLCETESMVEEAPSGYYLITLKINKTGVLYYGTHKLRTPFSYSISKPRLYLPKPCNTAFVIIGNSIVLTDVDPAYIESQNTTTSYYKPRWEDVIKLKSSVQIVGQGYENEDIGSNPSVVLLTSNSGVLRIEKFPNSADEEDEEGNDEDSMDVDSVSPISIIKSHIEQGIFFAKSSEIEFDLFIQNNNNNNNNNNINDTGVENGLVTVDPAYSEKTIKMSCLQIIDEILTSTSRYLPDFLPSVKDFLNLKISLFRELIAYVKRNFPTFCQNIIPNIVERLEKASVGLQLWTTVEDSDIKVHDILKSIISKYVPSTVREDVVRFFLNHKLQYINDVLTEFIENLIIGDISLTFVNDLLVNTLYHGVFLFEEEYILKDTEIELRKIWIFDTDLIIKFEEIFRKIYGSGSGAFVLEKSKEDNFHLCEVLYYFVTSAVQYMQQYDSTNRQQLKEYIKWYRSSKIQWIKSLLSKGLEREAIVICEKYHDLYSLVEVLEKLKATGGIGNDLYESYFGKFGYEFASSLYDYYILKDLIDQLLLGFSDYRPFLLKYFQENPEKTNKVAWIRDFLDENFIQGSQRLVDSTAADERVENKELKFSLAKLASLAYSSEESELFTTVNSNLIILRIQDKLFQELSKSTSGEGELLTLDYVSKNFRNELVSPELFKQLVEEPLKALSSKKSVSPIDLILLLTLLKPTLNSGKNFAYALRITSLITNESVHREQCQLVWLRLLTITDGWKSITQTEHQTDDVVKQRVSNSILYKTFKAIGVDNELVSQLNQVLSSAVKVDDNFSKELLIKLDEYVSKYDLTTWVNSIKLQVVSGETTTY